jgi:hypothetical protein
MVARHSFESEGFAECEECFEEEQVDGMGLCESCSATEFDQEQQPAQVIFDKVRNLEQGLPSNWTLKQVEAEHTKPCTDCSTDVWPIGGLYAYDHEDPRYGEKLCLGCAVNRYSKNSVACTDCTDLARTKEGAALLDSSLLLPCTTNR